MICAIIFSIVNARVIKRNAAEVQEIRTVLELEDNISEKDLDFLQKLHTVSFAEFFTFWYNLQFYEYRLQRPLTDDEQEKLINIWLKMVQIKYTRWFVNWAQNYSKYGYGPGDDGFLTLQ